MMRSAGFSVCAKKNQCHQARAKRASQRSTCSITGTPSISTSRSTAPGWSIARAERDERAAVVPDDGEALVAERAHQRDARRAAIARFEYGAWSGVVAGLDDSP